MRWLVSIEGITERSLIFAVLLLHNLFHPQCPYRKFPTDFFVIHHTSYITIIDLVYNCDFSVDGIEKYYIFFFHMEI